MIAFTPEQIKEIAEQLDCGFLVFYHRRTGESLSIPDHNEFHFDESPWQEAINKVEDHPGDSREIPRMSSGESFRVMEDFTDQVTDPAMKQNLQNALKRKKSFREFKSAIDSSDRFRQLWFAHKDKCYIEWVKEQLELVDKE